jgi:putative hemolysin
MQPSGVKERFAVIFIKDKALLDEAKQLRGKVFFNSAKKDEDEFDEFCDHLVVLDKEKNEIIGTYRLLLGSVAHRHLGFYSETEFDLTNIKINCKGEVLEMSRACVLSTYRKYPIINLLWNEILAYFERHKVKYVFGCPSIENPSEENIGKLFAFFRHKCFAPLQFRVEPLKNKLYHFDKNIKIYEYKEILHLLPSLIRGYLKMGAFICGEPAYDKKFGTADFFTMLDIRQINEVYRKRFL